MLRDILRSETSHWGVCSQYGMVATTTYLCSVCAVDLDEELLYAVSAGSLNDVVVLVDAGASPNWKNRKGYSCFDLAVMRHVAAVNLL